MPVIKNFSARKKSTFRDIIHKIIDIFLICVIFFHKQLKMKEKIIIKDLHKSFGPKVVLDGLDLTVYESEILCIIGISGVGKSVILKNLIGILDPDSGSIHVDGVEFTGADAETRHRILAKYGILFQGAALFDSLNIYDNVAFGLRRKKVPEEMIEKTVTEMLENVGLREWNQSGYRSYPAACRSGRALRVPSRCGQKSCSMTSRRPGLTP